MFVFIFESLLHWLMSTHPWHQGHNSQKHPDNTKTRKVCEKQIVFGNISLQINASNFSWLIKKYLYQYQWSFWYSASYDQKSLEEGEKDQTIFHALFVSHNLTVRWYLIKISTDTELSEFYILCFLRLSLLNDITSRALC